MTKVILIRHGETIWNSGGRFQGHSDIALSPIGIKQAELLAARLSHEKIDAIYASDLSRAYETAQCVAGNMLSVKRIPGLREICFGLWEGLTFAEIEDRWPALLKRFFARPEEVGIPEGESFDDVQKRSVAAVDDILSKHKGQTVVIVAHGGVNRVLLAAFLHMPLNYLWTIKQDNTALNILHYDGEHNFIESLNDSHHLD